jgi:putative protease
MADVGCRNTVFGVQAQVSVHWIERWQNAGIQHFRIEFADESPEQVRGATSAFQQFFSGTLATRQLAEYLSHTANGGTTTGSFYVPSGQYSMKPQV